MPDRVVPGPLHGSPCVREAVCTHTKKIYDSCRLRECMQELRVYLSRGGQEVLERASSVKPGCVELLWVYLDVEQIPFNKGFFSVDAQFIYRVSVDAYCGVGRPYTLRGMAVYNKRVVLYGGEGCVRIFGSKFSPCAEDLQAPERNNMPTATVEVVEPILLSAGIVEKCCDCDCDCGCQIPEAVGRCFEDELMLRCDGRKLYVSIGQFGIIRLERDSQLLLPSYDFCLPEKECKCAQTEDPCDMFSAIAFPVSEFFPGAETEHCK